MTSYNKHQQLTAYIVELANILAEEARKLHAARVAKSGIPQAPLDRSAECLRQALGPLITAIAILHHPEK